MTGLFFAAQLDIFSIRENRYLRGCGHQGDLSQLESGEFFTLSVRVKNNGNRAVMWKEACVRVDGGEPWFWTGGVLQPGGQTTLWVYHCNMVKCMTPGRHTAVWYFDGREVLRDQFAITWRAGWKTAFRYPGRGEIEAYQTHATRRSPYLMASLSVPASTRYTEYQIDFRANFAPNGTYFCLGCWKMDHSELEKRYRQVRLDGGEFRGYAGFQKIATGEHTSIMSFWDVFCTDARGKETTVQAKILYPREVIDGGRFWGEGTGARCSAYFDWQPHHWYRMELKCVAGQDTTFVEQWVQDLKTGARTMLSVCDTGVPNSAFRGSMYIFLENYLIQAAGEVRAMEVCHPRYLDEKTKRWRKITEAYVTSQGGLPTYEGSYDFGVANGRLWMITSGVGGDWFHNGKGKSGVYVTL